MRKKYRSIIIDNKEYTWIVTSDHDEGIMIRIFENKKPFFRKYIYGNWQITPKYIEELIKNQQNASKEEKGDTSGGTSRSNNRTN